MTANKTRLLKRLIALLNARPNDTTFASSVNGENGTFSNDDELDAALIDGDAMVVSLGYLPRAGHPLRAPFLSASSNLVSGDAVPQSLGEAGKVELSINGATGWQPGKKATSKADVINAEALAPFVEGGIVALRGFYFIEDGYFYTTSPFGRIFLPQFEKTTALQAHEAHESIILAASMMQLNKNGSNAKFAEAEQKFYRLLPAVLSGEMQLPNYENA